MLMVRRHLFFVRAYPQAADRSDQKLIDRTVSTVTDGQTPGQPEAGPEFPLLTDRSVRASIGA
jgi:hypothetical protein